MPNVFLVSMWADTNGQAARIARGINRLAPDWTARAMRAGDVYFRWPIDMTWNTGRARQFYEAADVVHMPNGLTPYLTLDRGQRKPTILHHHGTGFRRDHAVQHAQAQRLGVREVVSTLDLQLLEADLAWLPAPYQLSELLGQREAHYQPHERVLVHHSATNRENKDTDALVAAVASLQRRGLAVDLDIVEGKSFKECWRRKAQADIVVDQLWLGYGCSAVEAWGMGLPVIGGVRPPLVRDHMLATWGSLPFLEATRDTLEERLAELVTDAQLRAAWAATGRAHFDRFHDERQVVARLLPIYEGAPATAGGPLEPLPYVPNRQRHQRQEATA